jgi:hypothetical protein
VFEYDIQAGEVLVDCGLYVTPGDEPRDILEKDCRDSSGETELESRLGANSGISNDIELGRFDGLRSPNVAEVGENAAFA